MCGAGAEALCYFGFVLSIMCVSVCVPVHVHVHVHVYVHVHARASTHFALFNKILSDQLPRR